MRRNGLHTAVASTAQRARRRLARWFPGVGVLRPRRGTDLAAYHDLTRRYAASGRHRLVAGGQWETIGPLLAEHVIGQGLAPHERVLDIGCGALRVGVHLVDYLDAGNYYGIDRLQEMLDAGYDVELPEHLQRKLPRHHLVVEEHFDVTKVASGVPFDVALAFSVFTHLPIGYLRLCLTKLAPAMKPGGVLHATTFVVPGVAEWAEPHRHQPGDVVTYPVTDPYHHTRDDLHHAAAGLPWQVDGPYAFGHPRAQQVMRFTRREGDADPPPDDTSR